MPIQWTEGEEGEVVYENFNAASAKVFFEGVNVHTGSAYGVTANACRLAMEFLGRMPQTEVPEKTLKCTRVSSISE